jgi:hypothetical protein
MDYAGMQKGLIYSGNMVGGGLVGKDMMMMDPSQAIAMMNNASSGPPVTTHP